MAARKQLVFTRCEKSPSPTTASCSSEEDIKDNMGRLPAIGVFWDIENCQVPRGKSAAAVAQTIRSRFFSGHREVEFVVVCDVTKENPRIVEELHCAKVNLLHVSATSKNAADDKLRQRIRHFGETYACAATLLLITGDINFSSELIELRHKRMMHVVLLHNSVTTDVLKMCANESYLFSDVLDNIPDREIDPRSRDECGGQVDVWVYNLPEHEPPYRVKSRLKYLCSNCGGRVGYFNRNLYYVRFANVELATRAARRMNGQDVFGRRIMTSEPRTMEWSRTPGRNRPQQHQPQQEELVKPWDTLLANNTHQPARDSKVANIENLRHLSIGDQQRNESAQQPFGDQQQQHTILNNLRKATIQAAHSSSLARLNNYCDSKPNMIDYCTDSSSGACDEDSDGDGEGSETGRESGGCVDLRVTGLDPLQDLTLTRSQMHQVVNKFVKVVNLSVFTQTDGSIVASIRTKSMADAQLLIANLQRTRIGNQRIKIAFHNSTPEQRQLLRRQVGDLLSKLEPKLPLFRFKELFKNEYLTSVSVSELRRMRDVCLITEEESGRMIQANPMARAPPFFQPVAGEWQEGAFCEKHYRASPGFIVEPPGLPSVRIRLNHLAERVQIMMQSHNGRIPLASLNHCYAARFGPLPVSEDEGVSLEHLVSCLPNVDIQQSQACHKFLAFSTNAEKSVEKPRPAGNGGLTSQLLELLKAAPKATLTFSSFIPAFHRRFGKQFRLSDFGYTKLQDLLESMSHVVQVTGFGSKKQVTLSHKSQVKRFKIDLLKVLKTLPKKSVELEYFGSAYRQVFSKPFEPWQYGLCDLEDLVGCCVGLEILINSNESGKPQVALNIRDQTAEELALTNRFKAEVVELLKHNPDCSMLFNKFVPAYHNYFGKQCRVASYGFHKLMDLFEAITDTVTVEESVVSDEKLLILTLSERLKVLGERISTVLTNNGGSVMMADLEPCYEMCQFGVIEPVQYECDSLVQLLSQLSDYVKMVPSPHGYLLQAVPALDTVVLDLRTRYLLLSRHRMSVDAFRSHYVATYRTNVNVELAASRIPQTARLITLDGIRQIHLTPRAVFANQVYTLLFENGGRIPLINFENAYSRRFGGPLVPSELGYSTISAMLAAFPETFTMQTSQSAVSYLKLNETIRDAGFSLPLPPNQTYNLWERPSLFNDLTQIKPPPASCLPLPTTLLTNKGRPASAPFS